jgi:hypothetical protein
MLLDAFNQVVALDDILESLPDLMRKREKIQSTRRRSDSEILGLFVDPMRTIVEQEAYLAEECRYLQLLDLTPLFGSPRTKPSSDLADRVSSLRRELNALQWVENAAASRPPVGDGGWGRRFRRARAKGFANMWQELLKRVNRGI